MASPYKKAERHALDCASRGLGVESCGYTSPTWRGAWLQAYQKAKQMDFELDNFDDDVNKAEDNINANTQPANKHLSETGAAQAATEENGNAQPDNKGEGTVIAHRQALGLFPGISNEKYHSGPGISSSNIKPALKSLNLYNETNCGRVPFEETEAMRLGTATHALILEAYDFGNQIAVSKKFGRTKAGKEEKAEFYAENKGKTVIDTDQYEKCQRMRDSLLNLEDVRDILSSGKPEVSGYYIDKGEHNNGTGMLCKMRPDWENSWCLPDVKTTMDVSRDAFSRTIHKLNYHVSAAHYLEGSRILTGQTHNQFPFLCVEPNPPYEAAVYILGPESLELGIKLRRYALNAIKLGRDTQEWPLINHGVAQSIEVPGYALNDARLENI